MSSRPSIYRSVAGTNTTLRTGTLEASAGFVDIGVYDVGCAFAASTALCEGGQFRSFDWGSHDIGCLWQSSAPIHDWLQGQLQWLGKRYLWYRLSHSSASPTILISSWRVLEPFRNATIFPSAFWCC